MESKNDQFNINICQYYSEANPIEGEIVLVQFTEKNDTFVKAVLLEYQYTGMMNYKDITKKRRVTSWNKYIQLNKNMVARVDEVDIDKKVVQLSLAFLDEGSKDEKNAALVQEKLMVPFNENKVMENFIKSICIQNIDKKLYDYNSIWTTLIHHIDSLRRLHNDENDENLSIWKYFNENINSIDEWIESSKLDIIIGDTIKFMYHKKMDDIIHKIISKIGIISLGGIDSTKELLKIVLSNITFNYTIKYETTPYYIFESSSNDSSIELHTKFVEQLEKESSKFNPKVFIKTEYVGKVLN